MNNFSRSFYAFIVLLLTAAANVMASTNEQDLQQWQKYHASSNELRQLDQQTLLGEIRALNLKKPLPPSPAKEFGFDANLSDEYLISSNGQALLTSILSFQTPSGGWSKRTDMRTPRTKGMNYGTEKNYIPTFDNNATITQLELLGRAYALTQKREYQTAFAHGLNLLLKAQAPHGGWPQNFPLVGGYHDHLTFNDALMANILKLLKAVKEKHYGENLVDAALLARVDESFNRAIDCVIATQVTIDGKKTIWAGQYDSKTLQPAKARAYEMASLATAESVHVLEVLMSIENPSAEVKAAITAAVEWFNETAILDTEWERGTANLIKKKGAEPLWGRFYDLSSNTPVFGDRDGQVHTDLKKVSIERIRGYAWYTTSPNKIIKRYPKWSKKHSAH